MRSVRLRGVGSLGAAVGVAVALGVSGGAAVATNGAADASPAAASSAGNVEPVRVMFVGDSITGSPGCWRAPLWVALTDAGHVIDAVGVRTDDECGGVRNAAGELWDPDNEGIGNITMYGQYNRLAERDTYAVYQPDVVVMLVGTNDVRGGADVDEVLNAYDLLLAQAREANPDVAFVLGTVTPVAESDCATCGPVIADLAAATVEWGARNTKSDSPVYVARLGVGFDPAVDTDDGLHPNASGNAKLAAAWLDPVERAVLHVEGRRHHGAIPVFLYVGFALLVAATAASIVFRAWNRR